MQNPPLHCKIFLHLIPEPEEKASELLRDLTANDSWNLRAAAARPAASRERGD